MKNHVIFHYRAQKGHLKKYDIQQKNTWKIMWPINYRAQKGHLKKCDMQQKTLSTPRIGQPHPSIQFPFPSHYIHLSKLHNLPTHITNYITAKKGEWRQTFTLNLAKLWSDLAINTSSMPIAIFPLKIFLSFFPPLPLSEVYPSKSATDSP